MNDKTKSAGAGDTGVQTGSGTAGAKPPQMPSIGRIVHVRDWSQGQQEPEIAAALITKVHSPTCINVRVFPDCGVPYSQTSIELDAPNTLTPGKWQWPTRT